MRRLAFLALALAGCGGSSTNPSNVTVGTSESKGSVGGVVLDTPALAPLAGAMVTVIAGGNAFTATTDMNGTFAVKDVPSGSVIVHVAAAEHYDVYWNGQLAAAAGNFPVDNASLTVGPIGMIGSKGSFAVRLVDETGAPVTSAHVTARAYGSWFDLSSGGPIERGTVEVGATSGSDGTATLAGIPDYTALGALSAGRITVSVPAAAVTGASGQYQFFGFSGDFYPAQIDRSSTGQTNTPTIVLAGPATPLGALSSNDEWFVTRGPGPLPPAIAATGTVRVVFNQALAATTAHALLLDEFGQLSSTTAMATAMGNTATVAFGGALKDGARYNLAFHVNAAGVMQKEYDITAPLFTLPAAGSTVSVTPSSHFDSASNDYVLVFSEPIGVGNGSASAIPCVTFYEADLDGTSTVSPGEWTGGGNAALKCETSGAHPGLYLRPDEQSIGPNSQAMPITGYSSQWRLAVKAVCAPNYLCSTAGRPVHLVFSRNTDPNSVVKRIDGTTVPDLTFTLPNFQ